MKEIAIIRQEPWVYPWLLPKLDLNSDVLHSTIRDVISGFATDGRIPTSNLVFLRLEANLAFIGLGV